VAHLTFGLICLVWGSSFILIERARHALGAADVAFGRVAGGAIVLAIAWALSRQTYRLTRRDLAAIIAASLVGTVIPFVLLAYCIAPERFGHSYFGMMVAFVPLATIVISVPLLRVWPTPRQFIGVLVGLACIFILVQDGGARGMSPALVALALVVPLGYATGNTLVKWRLAHIPAVPLTALLLAAATAMLLPLELFPAVSNALELTRPAEPRDWPQALAALAFLSVAGTGIAIWLFNGLIISHGPLFAGMVTYVLPVLALAWGHFDGERITWPQLAAMAGATAMVALVQYGGAPPAAAANRRPVLSAGATSLPQDRAEICSAAADRALLESCGEPE
jgi:drug/metabolite transporter (DMT)-like permease